MEMIILKTTDDLKQECIDRLRILKLDEKIINDFINKNKVYATIMNGDTLEVTQYGIVLKLMKSFEKNKSVKVYHIVSIEEELRTLVYILFVRNNKDEWNVEKGDLKRGFAEVSAFEEIRKYDNRHIGIEVKDGNVIRVSK